MEFSVKITVGTILEPKFDEHVGHCVVIEVYVKDISATELTVEYEIKNVKTKHVAIMTLNEILQRYNPIGQEGVGKCLIR